MEEIGFFWEKWKKMIFLPVSSERKWKNWKKVEEIGINTKSQRTKFWKEVCRYCEAIQNINANLLSVISMPSGSSINIQSLPASK